MKQKFNTLFAYATIALALAACSKEADQPQKANPNSKDGFIMTVKTAGDYTKTVIDDPGTGAAYNIKWQSTDQLGVFEVAGGVVQDKAVSVLSLSSPELIDGGAFANFTFSLEGNPTGSYKYAFVNPASALGITEIESEDKCTVELKQNQTFQSTSFDPSADLLVSQLVSTEERPTSVHAKFGRIGATARMVLKCPSTSETIQSITFSTTEGNISGYYTIDPATGEISKDIVSGQGSIILTPASDVPFDGSVVVWFRLAAISLDENFTVSVRTNLHEYTKVVNLSSNSKTLEFTDSKLTKFNVDMSSTGGKIPEDDYVILAYYSSSGYKAMSGEASGARLAQESFTLWNGSDEQVVLENKNIVWTIAKSGTGYTLTNKANGKKLNYGSNGSASTSTSGKTLTITEGTGSNKGLYTVTNSNFTLRHNSSSSFFAFYNTSTTMTNYFYFVKAVVKTKLGTPENVMADVENDDEVVIVWDAVEDAESYDVTLNGNTENTTELSYRFVDVPVGTYTASVVAKNSNTLLYENSGVGVSNSVKIGTPALAKPAIKTFTQKASGFSASWTAGDAYTTSYSWDLYEGSVADESLIGTGVTTDDSIDIAFESADFPESSFIADVTYYLVVTAKADGYVSTDSDAASFVASGSVTTYKWIRITAANQIEAGGQYILGGVLTSNSTYSYMPNTQASNSNPTTITSSLISQTEIADEDVTDAMIWDFVDAGEDKLFIQSHANSAYKLNTTASTGANIRISNGNTSHNKWTIEVNDSYGWDYHNDSMYLTVYAANAWRNYSNNSTNRNGTFIIFKRVEE